MCGDVKRKFRWHNQLRPCPNEKSVTLRRNYFLCFLESTFIHCGVSLDLLFWRGKCAKNHKQQQKKNKKQKTLEKKRQQKRQLPHCEFGLHARPSGFTFLSRKCPKLSWEAQVQIQDFVQSPRPDWRPYFIPFLTFLGTKEKQMRAYMCLSPETGHIWQNKPTPTKEHAGLVTQTRHILRLRSKIFPEVRIIKLSK